MVLNIDAKFEAKLTCAFKNDMSSKFLLEHVCKSKNWDFDWILLFKAENI